MSRSHPVDTAHVVPLLESYHAGALTPEEEADVSRHLRACAVCRGVSEDIALYQIIRAAPAPTVGPELRQRVYARIAAASAADSAMSTRTSGKVRQRERRADITSLEHPRGAHARGGWLSGAAAVALVAVVVGVFLLLPYVRGRGYGLGQHAIASPTTSTAPSIVGDSACPPKDISVKLPAHALIMDMALTSATSGWAVGDIMNSADVPSQGLIMRFSQCHWAPIAFDMPSIGLSAISMDSPSDGWAIGNYTDSNSSALLHYSDGAWKVVLLPDDPVIQQSSFETLRMRAPGDGWITAFTPKTPDGQTNPMLLLHLTGESLTPVTSPVAYLYDLAPVGPNDLWAIGQTADATGGDQPDTYRFAHYHDGRWSVTNQPVGAELTTLHATSPTDIWANGYIPNSTNPAASVPVVAHYDGTEWQMAPQSVPAGAIGIPLGNDVGWAYRSSHQFSTNGPAQSAVAAVWSETGGQWQSLPWPYKDIHTVRVWAPVSDHEFWVIGSYQVWTNIPNSSGGYSGSGSEYTVLLHYANGVWTRYG
ncbi:MAG TPA: zf-HC2 domain-containing protein [Ktedonobacterales bacterium]|nr:zf-HC2 domain-containing protein [Ktedonobacterales bacterium]